MRGTGPKTQATPLAAAVLLAVVTCTVVWSYIVMHMGRFAPDSSQGFAGDLAIYAGFVLTGASMASFPNSIGRALSTRAAIGAVALFMVLSATVKSFSYGQTLFDPAVVEVVGSLMAAASYGLAIGTVYPLVFEMLDAVYAGAVVIAAHFLKRLASPALDIAGMGVYTLLLAYGLPVITAVLCLVASNESSRDSFRAPAERPGAMPLTVLIAAGIAMAAVDLSDASGIWSTSQGTESGGALWVVVETLLLAACAFTLVPFRRTWLATRFCPLLLLAAVPSFAALSLNAAGIDGGYALAAFATAVSAFFHGATWVVTFACARQGIPVHRAIGVVLLVEALASAVSLGLADAFPAGAVVFPSLLCLAVSASAAWLPVAFPKEKGLSSDLLAAANAQTENPPQADLEGALRTRCREVSAAGGLSEREGDVLLLLVQGWSRQAICDSLGISEGTVKTHASHIYAKLGIQSRQDLASIVFLGREERAEHEGDRV